jgi:hypothetical protein
MAPDPYEDHFLTTFRSTLEDLNLNVSETVDVRILHPDHAVVLDEGLGLDLRSRLGPVAGVSAAQLIG